MGVCLLYTVSRMNLAGQCTSWRDEGDYMPCEAFLTQTQRRAQFSPSISASTGSHSAWWRQNTAERGRRRGRLVARSCWDTEGQETPKARSVQSERQVPSPSKSPSRRAENKASGSEGIVSGTLAEAGACEKLAVATNEENR